MAITFQQLSCSVQLQNILCKENKTIIATSPPGRGAKYCDKHVCLSLCLRNSKTTRLDYTVARSFSGGIAIIRYVLPVCFVDDVMFSHNGPTARHVWWYMWNMASISRDSHQTLLHDKTAPVYSSWAAHQGAKSALYASVVVRVVGYLCGDVASDVYDLLVGRQLRLTDDDVARELCVVVGGALDVLQTERAMKTVLRPVPDVTERYLLHHDSQRNIIHYSPVSRKNINKNCPMFQFSYQSVYGNIVVTEWHVPTICIKWN